MFGFRIVKGAAVGLATLGLVVPQTPALADSPKPAPLTTKSTMAPRVPDIVMTAPGTVSGRVCDHNGKVLDGAKVELKQDNKTIATAMTNKDGVYSFSNVKGGTYRMSSGNTEGIFRVWNEKTAPPTAKGHALLVMGENGARGQFGSIDPTLVVLTAGVIAAVVLSAIAIQRIDSVSTQVSQIPVSP